MSQPNYQKAKDEALGLLQKYEITDPFVNVLAIAEREGLTLREFDPDDNHDLLQVAGFFDPKTKTIFVNKTDPPNRKTFTIAHELGHWKLGHEPTTYGVLPRWQAPGAEKNVIEREANVFAANLLVPEKMLKEVVKKYSLSDADVSLLAKMFSVSEEVMRYRLIRLKYATS